VELILLYNLKLNKSVGLLMLSLLKQNYEYGSSFVKLQINKILGKEQSGQEMPRKTYALLTLARCLLLESTDIEDVYNAKKVFDLAFSYWNIDPATSNFVFLEKHRFLVNYESEALIRHSEIDQEQLSLLIRNIEMVIRRIENLSLFKTCDEVDFALENRERFITFARSR
tara:strand:+ start:9723 stop:10232 length:510 start_codon:yes stop_codon:yes gene_type:complete